MMTLNEAVTVLNARRHDCERLTQELDEARAELTEVGKRVFSAVSKSQGATGTSVVTFQLEDEQYQVDSAGILDRINEQPVADAGLEIE